MDKNQQIKNAVDSAEDISRILETFSHAKIQCASPGEIARIMQQQSRADRRRTTFLVHID